MNRNLTLPLIAIVGTIAGFSPSSNAQQVVKQVVKKGPATVTINVLTGARQTFGGLGASTGNWNGEYQALTKAQRAQLSRMFWRGLNFKIFRLWFNVDIYSPTRGARDLSLFHKQYVQSGEIADAKANGVATLLFAPDHIDGQFYSHLDALQGDVAAWNDLSGISSHSYNMAATDKAADTIAGVDGRNLKEYWMTEASDNGAEAEGMSGIPAVRAASLSARFLNDMNHRVTHWVHFLGVESTGTPDRDDATRIIAFRNDPFQMKVMKKYFTYQQLARAFDVGAVFRDSQSSLDGDMTWTYGQKPHLISATARNANGSWSSGICNFTSDSFLGVQGWSDEKWNIEQGGHAPAQIFRVTLQIDELKNRAQVPFVVHRTNDTLKNARAETIVMKNGSVNLNVAPLELVTLRSATR